MRVQPAPEIYWKVQNRVPGLNFRVQQIRMDLLYSSRFTSRRLPEAYERLLLEVVANDHSHFVSADELLASWRIFTPALTQLASLGHRPEGYAYGSRGPAGQDALARRHGLAKFGGNLAPYVPLGDLHQQAAAEPSPFYPHSTMRPHWGNTQ